MTRMPGGGGTDYDKARETLQAQPGLHIQHGAAKSTRTSAEALHLIHAALSGLELSGLDQGAHGAAVLGAGDSSRSAELLAALVAVRHLRAELAGWEPRLIAAARASGVSWAALASALGVTSRQAAERRYLRLRPSATGEPTGEGRVLAERTKRAGDRAVAQWARQNSAFLRRLAGQISALDGLTASAREHADRVQQALADDDPAALLSPLADARAHLVTSHALLVEQINTITRQVERLRRDTRDRRDRARGTERTEGLSDH